TTWDGKRLTLNDSSWAIRALLNPVPLMRRRLSRKTSRFRPGALIRSASGCFLRSAGGPRRPGYITLFVNEIEILVVALNRLGNQHVVLTLARLGLLANVAIAIDKVEVFLIVPIQVQPLYFFCHSLIGRQKRMTGCHATATPSHAVPIWCNFSDLRRSSGWAFYGGSSAALHREPERGAQSAG